jgi:PhnB protein
MKMAIGIYVYFNGNCREAVEFYAQVFGVEIPRILTYGEAPSDPAFTLPEAAKNLILHTFLNIKGTNVMFSDVFPGRPFTAGNNINLSAASADMDEVKSIFGKLKEGGTVGMELQETFFSKCYGTVIDKFGIGWQIMLEGREPKQDMNFKSI